MTRLETTNLCPGLLSAAAPVTDTTTQHNTGVQSTSPRLVQLKLREVQLDLVTDIPTHMVQDTGTLIVTYPDPTLMGHLGVPPEVSPTVLLMPLLMQLMLQ